MSIGRVLPGRKRAPSAGADWRAAIISGVRASAPEATLTIGASLHQSLGRLIFALGEGKRERPEVLRDQVPRPWRRRRAAP